MPKLPECSHCQFYARSAYTVCAVHPYGVDGDNCLDFRLNPNAEPDLEKLLATLRSHHIQP